MTGRGKLAAINDFALLSRHAHFPVVHEMEQDDESTRHLLVQHILTCETMSAVEHGWVSLEPPTPLLITEMRSGIRVARGALSVRPSGRLIQLGVKNEKCHERRHQIILRRGRKECRRCTYEFCGEKKLACRSDRMEERKKEKGEKVRVLFLDTFHFAAAAAANCNRATTQQRQTAASCQVVILRLGEEQTWMATPAWTKLKPV